MKAFLRESLRLVSVSAWLALSSPLAWAADLTIPNTFVPGAPASAASVNQNFSATQSAVNSKQDRVAQGCSPGQSIQTINQNGSVVCQVANDTSGVEFVNNVFGVTINGTTATVATITATVPAAGFLIATVYGNASCSGTSVTVTLQNATTAITSPTTFDSRSNGNFQYYITNYVFQVNSGANVINAQANCSGGTGLMNVNTLNAIFVPNRY
jgi:hypothetical protein